MDLYNYRAEDVKTVKHTFPLTQSTVAQSTALKAECIHFILHHLIANTTVNIMGKGFRNNKLNGFY